MYRSLGIGVLHLFILIVPIAAESLRALVEGSVELSADNMEGVSIVLSHNGTGVIRLGRGVRFFRGVELELSAPQAWLSHRGSLAMMIYADLDRPPPLGINDLEGRRIVYDPLPNKINMVYQIPIRRSHGLRTTPYATVPVDILFPDSFPLLFRLTPIIKGLSDELENMQFLLIARPILGDEGEVRLNFRYPEQLRGKPFTVLIDDVVVENSAVEQLLKEGEHHLVVLSDDYRNESRRFMVERARRLDIVIDLQDPTPLIIFEAPENALIFLNNAPIAREIGPIPVEPGVHEAKFQVGDYTLTKILTIQRGKTYRVALSVDIAIEENE